MRHFWSTPSNGHYRTGTISPFSATNGLMRRNKIGAVSENRLSGVQLIEQRLGLLQVQRVKALGEPVVDRREKIVGLVPLPLIAP